MENRKKDGRKNVVMVDMEMLVPKDHIFGAFLCPFFREGHTAKLEQLLDMARSLMSKGREP